ncbi:MAG: hypothetical protein ACAI35_23035 [Candidatus Methylacidiphilales bacterium]|nr:hypothetical protein [Candidatus Methylacidiphilales bacterium]
MNPDTVVRLFFVGLFILNLAAGVYLLRHQERLFGANSGFHTDTTGARDYNKLQVWATWVHVALLTGAFAIFY